MSVTSRKFRGWNVTLEHGQIVKSAKMDERGFVTRPRAADERNVQREGFQVGNYAVVSQSIGEKMRSRLRDQCDVQWSSSTFTSLTRAARSPRKPIITFYNPVSSSASNDILHAFMGTLCMKFERNGVQQFHRYNGRKPTKLLLTI